MKLDAGSVGYVADANPRRRNLYPLMTLSFETVSICGIVFTAALVRSTLGFGEALVAMPLLALVIPLHAAAPLVAMLSLCNGLVILYRERRHVRFGAAVSLVVPLVVGIPLGVWLLRSGDERIAKALLGVMLIGFSSWSLARPGGFALENDRWAPLAGLVAGFLGGAYNTAGPPLVIYGTLRRWPAERFRAMLQSCFSVAALWIVSMHYLAGLITSNVLDNFAVCLPIALCAVLAGPLITRRLSPRRFISVVHVALLLMGVLLLASTVW